MDCYDREMGARQNPLLAIPRLNQNLIRLASCPRRLEFSTHDRSP